MLLILLLAIPTMKVQKQEGEQYGKSLNKEAVSSVENFDLSSLKRKTEDDFEYDKARQQMKTETAPNNEVLNYLKSPEVQNNYQTINTDEYYFKRSDEITGMQFIENSKEASTSSSDTLHTCLEAGAPYTKTVVRNLQINFKTTKENKIGKSCLGHTLDECLYWGSQSDANKWITKMKEEMAKDPSIEFYDAFIHEHSRGECYLMRATWKHYNDYPNCQCYAPRTVVEEHIEDAVEEWVYEDHSLKLLFENPQCTLFETTCLDASPKVINGKEFNKQCWKEKLTYVCRHPQTKECTILRSKNCQEVNRICKQESEYGCALWEITYKCFGIRKQLKDTNSSEFYGMDQDSWEVSYEPNQSFSDVATRLSLFDEMKKDLEIQNTRDANKVSIFNGREMRC